MTDYDGFSHFARIPRPHREGKTPNDGLIHHPSWAFPGGDHLCRAQEFVNAAGLRLVRMPMGGRGVAHPPGADLEQVRWALGILGLAHLPLFLNDDDCRWVSYREWIRRQPALWSDEEPRKPVGPTAPVRRRRRGA